MKDMFGSEIEVGDELVYASESYSLMMTFGTAHKVFADHVIVDRKFNTLYQGVKDGMQRRYNYHAKAGEDRYTTVKARKTTISMPSRVVVLRKSGQ